jgi:hypothetical protein
MGYSRPTGQTYRARTFIHRGAAAIGRIPYMQILFGYRMSLFSWGEMPQWTMISNLGKLCSHLNLLS